MKKFANFKEEKKTEKAILISTAVEETGRTESFWLPLSKVEINSQEISIDPDFWMDKLAELKSPKEETTIIHSSVYEKGEKATKLIIEVLFQEKAQQLFLWIPNSKISNLEITKDEEENKINKVTVPKWIWENSYSDAISYQLEFWNKDDNKYSSEDFKLLSKIN